MPQNKIAPLIIGLTGSIGSGKTTVSGMFKRLGCRVIDADKLAHGFFKKNSPSYKKIVKHFGKIILKPDGVISRKILASLVFGDYRKLKFLNGVIHPLVIAEIKRKISTVRAGIIIVDVPLLFESGFDRKVDRIIVVKADKKVALARFLKKGEKKDDFLRRLKIQMPLADKIKRADFIIDNNGSRADTERKVRVILEVLNKEQ